MKRMTLTATIAGLLSIIMLGMVFHAPVTVYIQAHLPSLGLAAKAWKELLMLLVALLLSLLVAREHRWREVFTDRLVQLGVGYGILHLLAAFLMRGDMGQVVAGLLIDLRFVAYFVLTYIFLRLRPRYSSWLLTSVVVGSIIVLAFACLQVVLPRDFLTHIGYGPTTIAPYMTVDRNYDYVRFSSTLRGPNPLGAYAASALVMIAAYWSYCHAVLSTKRQLMIGAFAVMGCIAVWVSYARSGYLALVIGVAIIVLAKAQPLLRRWLVLAGAAMLIVGSTLLLTIGRANPVISNIVFHENPGEGGVIDSNGQHLQSLSEGIAYALTHPFGAGIGSTGSASIGTSRPLIIENQYLFISHEVGFVGAGLFVWLFGLVLLRLWRRRRSWMALGALASGVGIAVIGIILPVWVDDTVSIIWWGLAAIVLANNEEGYDKSTKQKTA